MLDTSPQNIIAKEAVNTTCCYCGVGCGVVAEIENNRVVGVHGDVNHPANHGKLCVKGSSLHETQNAADRLLTPKLFGEDVSWDEALDYSAAKFKKIISEYGPDAVAFYISGQLLTEDYYVANKLMKGFIGTANVDTNSRLCMASAVVAHKRAFGADTVPGCYEDLELADLIILVGSNMAYAHPIVYQRIVKAKEHRPELKIVVLDPRRTATCEIADVHLPIRAGSDGYFFNGLLGYLADQNKLDNAFIDRHCEHFDHALSVAKNQVPDVSAAAHHCQVNEEALLRVYRWFANTEKAVSVFSQGINQSSSGVDKGNALINCHLATGKIGKVGATPFSITGQPNAMGGREVGGLANQLASHMSFQNPEDVARVASFWQATNMAKKEGLKAVDMFKAVDAGKVKAIWIMATNPVVSMPDADAVKRALEKCELVIVSECIANTDTAKMAHVLLPATTWSEKHGTVTNSERRISLQKGFLPAPGLARHDWQIICDFAQKMGFHQGFHYQHPSEIFCEHAALSGLENKGTRGFDISALAQLSPQQYDCFQPIQWPVNQQFPHGRTRLFDDGAFFTKNQKAQFVPIVAQLPKVVPSDQQVIMNTGRIRDHWHTMSRTGLATKLWGHTDEPFIEVHPDDVQRFQLQEGGLAVLENRGSQYIGRVRTGSNQQRGNIFVPMHWNAKFASHGRADALVNDITDPNCGQPEFKHSPVLISPFVQMWQGYLLCQKDVVPNSEYWTKIPIANGFKFRLAHRESKTDWRQWLHNEFGVALDWIEMRDSAGKTYRAAGFVDGVLQVILILSSVTQNQQESRWVENQLGQKVSGNHHMALLAGRAPGEQVDEGNVVCSCFQIGEKTIDRAIAAGCKSVSALGEALRCGTNCGSCIPELKARLRLLETSVVVSS